MSEEMVVNTEVTDPNAEGSNEPEVTEQADVVDEEHDEVEETSNSKADESFAAMRHRIKELEESNAELQRKYDTSTEALGHYFNAADEDELALVAIAEAQGIPLETLRQVKAEEEANAKAMKALETENEQLRAEHDANLAIEQERMMKEDLAEIQKLNPDIKTFDDLPDEYFELVANGHRGAKAYRGAMAMLEEAPKPPGKAGIAPEQIEYLTKEEVEGMSREEIRKNMSLIDKSMKFWKKE